MQCSTKCVQSLAFCLVVIGAAIPAVAQETPKAELSGGYQLNRFDEETVSKGWSFDVAGNLNKMIGIVGEVGGVYKSKSDSGITDDMNIHQFMGGVRLNGRQNPKAAFFGQILAGAARVSFSESGSVKLGSTTITINQKDSKTDFALQIGGGVNVRATGKVGVRIGADYVRIFHDDKVTNIFRFVAGIVLPLK